jgi:hypothetical protein
MMSVALTVRDDRWWGVTCLNDEFLLECSRLEETGDDDGSSEVQELKFAHSPPADRSGLQSLELDQVDPILDEAGVYTDQHPRVYMLTVLDTHLEKLTNHHEEVYLAFKRVIKSYVSMDLPIRGSHHCSLKLERG